MIKIDKKNQGFRLIILIVTILTAMFLSPLLMSLLLILSRGFNFHQVYAEFNLQMSNPSFLLLMQSVQALMVFVLPPFLLSHWYGERTSGFLGMVKAKPLDILLAIVSIMVAIPLINFFVTWNQSIHLPSFMEPLENWMRASEEKAEYATKILLQGKTLTDLLWQLLVVAVLAGFGEELLFRGTLQSILSSKGKIQLAIWITALVFSAIHLQFYGFIPRLLLGAWFGYLFFWTGSIWVPVIAHFTNNAISVMFHFSEQRQWLSTDPDLIGVGKNTWQLIPSILLLLACILYFYAGFRKSAKKRRHV